MNESSSNNCDKISDIANIPNNYNFFCIRQGKLRLSRNILMQVYSGHSFKVQRAISSQEAVGGAGPGGGRPATAP